MTVCKIRRTHFPITIAAALAAITASSCVSGPPPPVDERPYEERVVGDRARKDAEFRAPDNKFSPVPQARRVSFPPLAYYPVRAEYRAPAALTEIRSGPPVVIELPNTAHQLERKVKVGTLSFTLLGKVYTLSAFAERAGDVQRLWVPFRDLTSGLETYGGGRYLDLDQTPTGLYDLDFNRAYNPYCVYDASWVCPYPPRENRLEIAIRAGERLPDARPE
jgi:uncharacterized protein (DUF1684 family)